VLALGLGLVFSEIYIPLRVLPLSACTHHCGTSEGFVVLWDHTNCVCGVAATMYCKERGPQRFGRKLSSEDDEERSESDRYLHAGKAQGLSTLLPDRKHGPCEGFLLRGSTWTRGSEELLDTSVITDSLTGVCMSTILYLPHLYYVLRFCALHF
jgi:hypothetical protein